MDKNADQSTCARAAARRRSGFTLIELMVVILVICLLAAMTFRMIGNVQQNRKKAQTQAILEKVALALEAYKSLYGKYPPVPYYEGGNGAAAIHGQPVRFEFPQFDEEYFPEFSAAMPQRFVTADEAKEIPWQKVEGRQGCGVFTFGLCSFFLPRYQLGSGGGLAWFGLKNAGTAAEEGDADSVSYDENAHVFEQWRAHNKRRADSRVGDSTRDLNAVAKILPLLGGSMGPDGKIDGGIINIVSGERKELRHVETPGGTFYVAVSRGEIKDAWGEGNSNLGEHELHYYSRPPYETYQLRSAGPDDMTIGDRCGNKAHKHAKSIPDGNGGTVWVVGAGDIETVDDIVCGSD